MSLRQQHASKAGGSGGGKIFLAAFGKHPGWNDHIEDIGIETQRLVDLKRFLYVEGIAGNIDSGAWDRLDESRRLADFKHVFLWRNESGLIAGRMWSSRDGKGRAKYPMVVCVQCVGVSEEWVLAEVLPRLETIQAQCVATTSAAEVVAIMDRSKAELSALAERALPPIDPWTLARGGLARLAERKEFAPPREGLFRVLYQIEREMADYLPGGADLPKGERPHPCQFRVPACGQTPGESIAVWLGFLMGQVSPAAAILLIAPLEEPWVDVVVGEPEPRHVFILKATQAEVPLTTEIPYSMDADFLARCSARVDAALGGREELPAASAISSGAARHLAAVVTGSRELAKSLKSPRLVKIVLIALAAVVAAIVLIKVAPALLNSPPSSQPKIDAPPPGPKPAQSLQNPHWQDLCSAYASWFSAFLRDMDGQRRQQWQKDEQLQPILAVVLAAEANNVELDPRRIANAQASMRTLAANPTPEALCAEGVAKTEAAWRAVSQVRSQIEAMPETIKALSRPYESRGWKKPLAQIDEAAAASSSASAVPSAGDAQQRAAVLGLVKAADARWKQVEALASQLDATGDKVLAAFRPYALAATASAENLRDLIARMDEPLGVGKSLAAFVDGSWKTQVDQALFAAGRKVKADEGGANRYLFEQWMAEAKEYVKLAAADDPRQDRSAWTARLDAAGADIKTLEKEDPNAGKAFTAKCGEARSAVEAMWALPAIQKNKAQIARSVSQCDQAIATLAGEVKTELVRLTGKPSDWEKGMRELASVSTSPAVNKQWQQRRDELLSSVDVAKLPPAEFLDLQKKAAALEAALRWAACEKELAKDLPGASALPAATYNELQKLMAARREQSIGQILTKFPSGPAIRADDPAVAPVRQEVCQAYSNWVTKLAAVMQEAVAIHDALAALCLLGDKMPSAEKTVADAYAALCSPDRADVVKDASAAMEGLTRRVERLKEIASLADRKKLVDLAVAAPAGEGEAVLAVWKRLGELKAPAWPASPAELSQELDLRGRLTQVLNQAKGNAKADLRVKAVKDDLAAEGHRRWAACLAALQQPADIEAAINLRKDFPVQQAQLDPAARFDILLFDTFGRLEDLPRSAEQTLPAHVAAFLAEARKFPAEFLARPPVAKMLAEMDSFKNSSPAASSDLSKVGPRLAGWQGQIDAETSDAAFSWTSKSSSATHELRFGLVKPSDAQGRAFYLCTTEVSIGLLIDVVGEDGQWDVLGGLMKDLLKDYAGLDDPRKGPRAWELSGASKAWRPASQWLFQPYTNLVYYAPGIEKELPSRSSPAQYVSADLAVFFARRLGCRLPSPAEWKAAYDASEKATPAEKWNLRDAAWARQQDYVAKVRSSDPRLVWPDEDIFWPADMPKDSVHKGEAAVAAVKTDDGVAFFAPVDKSGARKFAHLVGNVAEFVYDDPPGMEKLSDLTAQAVRKFLDGSPARLAVIGGSALSPAEIKVDAPSPVSMDDAHRGYSDVGFRLAFTAPGESLTDKLVKLSRAGWYVIGR